MAAAAVQNPVVAAESKSAKKKKTKTAIVRTESPAPPASATSEKALSTTGNENQADDPADSPFARELKKTIRNTSKKLMNAAKIDALIAEHSGKSLDDLVAQKIINADQKAAHLKKPGLQAQLFQLEEQLSQTKKMEAEFRARLAEQEQLLTKKFAKEKLLLAAEVKEKAAAEAKAELEANLLVLSQFLRVAAARRVENLNQEADENKALEGVLLNIYSGDEHGVVAMLKLVQGLDEPTQNTYGEPLETTYAQVKEMAALFNMVTIQSPARTTELESEPTTVPPQTDPTVAHAGLTEIDDGTAVAMTNGQSAELPADGSNGHPSPNMGVNDSAANAAGASPSDNSAPDMTASQEWVEVPRDLSETDNGLQATPAAPSGITQSWADDQPDPAGEGSATNVAMQMGDGFHQVQRGRGGGNGQRENNGWRGSRSGNGDHRGGSRSRGGGYRGEGGRGRGRGRGRGGMGGGPRRGAEQDSA